jgi:hypothetical protein
VLDRVEQRRLLRGVRNLGERVAHPVPEVKKSQERLVTEPRRPPARPSRSVRIPVLEAVLHHGVGASSRLGGADEDPVVYAGSGLGPGPCESWQPLNAGLSVLDVRTLALDATGRTLYAGTAGGGVVSLHPTS